MIKVAFNSFPLNCGHKTRGIGTYTRNLLEGLKQHEEIQVQEFLEIKEVRNADIVHYPYFDLFQKTLPLNKKFSTIVTIHDVTPLIFPEHYPPGIKGSLNNLYQKISLRNIAAVITDSKSSQKDISQYLGVPLSKIYPVHLSPGKHFKKIKDQKVLQGINVKYKLPHKFVLYTGSVNWNKNILNMAQATINANVDLVLVGKDFEKQENLNHPEMRSYKQFLEKFSENPKIHRLGFLPDDDLVAVMNAATVLLLPSFYEGFGLTILEAQICGTPAITSNMSSMPEVAGEGAVLIDPNSIEEITKAISEVLESDSKRAKLSELGMKNVLNFSWEKTAQETIQVYEKITRN